MGNGEAVAHKNASFLLFFCLHRGATLPTTVKWGATRGIALHLILVGNVTPQGQKGARELGMLSDWRATTPAFTFVKDQSKGTPGGVDTVYVIARD